MAGILALWPLTASTGGGGRKGVRSLHLPPNCRAASACSPPSWGAVCAPLLQPPQA